MPKMAIDAQDGKACFGNGELPAATKGDHQHAQDAKEAKRRSKTPPGELPCANDGRRQECGDSGESKGKQDLRPWDGPSAASKGDGG